MKTCQAPKTTRRATGTHVYGYEFEEAILGEYGYNHFMASLCINVQEGDTASVCLNQEFGRVEERGGGVFSEKWGRGDAKLLLNVCIDVRLIGWGDGKKQDGPLSDSRRKVSTSAAAAS